MRPTSHDTRRLPPKDPAAWLADVHEAAQAARFAEQAQAHAALRLALSTYRAKQAARAQRAHVLAGASA